LLVTQKVEKMKKGKGRFLSTVRFTCLAGIILLGFITITGTGGGDEASIPDTRERGEFNFVVTEYIDGSAITTRIDTKKYDIDETLIERKVEYYDVDGNLEKEEFDDNGDGTLDRTYTYMYVDGNLDEARYDYDNDGEADVVSRFDYDDAGNVTKREADNDYDQAEFDPDEAEEFEYEFINGEWRMTLLKQYYIDYDPTDPLPDRTFVIDNNDDYGYRVQAEGFFGDEVTGELYVREVYTQLEDSDNDAYYLETAKSDNGPDNNIDYTTIYGYDENWNRTSIEFLIGEEDGSLVSVTTFVYDFYDSVNDVWYKSSETTAEGYLINYEYYEYNDEDWKMSRKETYYKSGEEPDLIYTWIYQTIQEQ
jgi:hypothetical protein